MNEHRIDQNVPTFDHLPKAVSNMSDKLSRIEMLLLNLFKPGSESDTWFDLNEFCAYHPDKPAKPTVYFWVQKGLIPYHKKSKKLSFLKSEIDAFLKEGRRMTKKEIQSEARHSLPNLKR